MTTTTYRGYTIHPHPWPGFGYEYYPTDYNGESTHSAKSIEDAKNEIDTIHYESGFVTLEPSKQKRNWLVVFKEEVLTTDSFIDALECAWRNNALMLVGKDQPEYKFI